MMAKKYFQKALSVGLSLTLCAGLIAPSLAATFNELNDAVNGGKYDEAKFEVTQTEDGTERTVKLLEEVTWQNNDPGSIQVQGKTVTIDLNGWDITANGSKDSSAIWVYDGGNFTLTDTHKGDGPDGKITNAGKSAVFVGKDSVFTMDGGEISDNNALHEAAGGGVTVVNGGQFFMKNGVIKGNTSEYQADDVFVNSNDSVNHENETGMDMTGGALLGEVKGDPDKVSISGGTVSAGVDESLLAENCGLMDNGDGTYDVVDHTSCIWSDEWVEIPAQIGVEGSRTYTCMVKGCGETRVEVLPALVEVPGFEPVVVIDEPAVPLASGPVTQGEFVDYLWRHEDEPEGEPNAEPIVADDHEYAPAINWAQSIGIISAETFEADELITVALARDILTRFALYADMAMPELTTLSGEDDEAVLNCDEVLAEFFGEE